MSPRGSENGGKWLGTLETMHLEFGKRRRPPNAGKNYWNWGASDDQKPSIRSKKYNINI